MDRPREVSGNRDADKAFQLKGQGLRHEVNRSYLWECGRLEAVEM